MSNSANQQQDEQRMPDWYDPFPEPNTMPRKWDLSQYGYQQSDKPQPNTTDPRKHADA